MKDLNPKEELKTRKGTRTVHKSHQIEGVTIFLPKEEMFRVVVQDGVKLIDEVESLKNDLKNVQNALKRVGILV